MSYRKAFQKCRSFGHQWRYSTLEKIFDVDDRATWFIQHLQCSSCGTEKLIEVNPYGEVAARRYRYMDGYQVKGSLSIEDKNSMRKGLIDG